MNKFRPSIRYSRQSCMKEACPISKCGKVHGMCPHTLLGQLSPTYKFELAVGLDGGAYRCMLWDVLKTLLTEECKCIADEADTEIKCTCNPANVIPSKKHQLLGAARRGGAHGDLQRDPLWTSAPGR